MGVTESVFCENPVFYKKNRKKFEKTTFFWLEISNSVHEYSIRLPIQWCNPFSNRRKFRPSKGDLGKKMADFVEICVDFRL